MHLFLEVTSGPAAGRKLHLKAGQTAKIGRTDWADFSIHEDPSLADVHFQLDCESQACRLRDLNTGSGTFLNDKPVAGIVTLTSGATVRAGQTSFLVTFDETGLSSTESVVRAASNGDKDEAPAAVVESVDAVTLCAKLTLSEVAQQIATPTMQPPEFVERLLQSRSYPDALRVIAFTLPKPRAVLWAVDMVKSIGGAIRPGIDEDAIAAAIAWAQAPEEAKRRQAQTAANATKMQTAAGWIALAAFWSGGSLSAPELPVVPPGENLTCQALTGALMLAVGTPPVSQMTTRYEAMIRKGLSDLQSQPASAA